MRPPVPGMHGRFRVFGTPGPIGWNDHGDPAHARQVGPTPGSLGVNDHGSPVPPPAALLLAERRQETEAHLNRIIEEANAATHPQAEQKLQACLDAVKNRDRSNGLPDETGRCAEAYFYARLQALQGKSAPGGGDEQALWHHALPTGGVEYRASGAFAQRPGSLRPSKASLALSYERIGQTLPARDAGLAAGDSPADWIERGIQDGQRDRSDSSEKLRPHRPIR